MECQGQQVRQYFVTIMLMIYQTQQVQVFQQGLTDGASVLQKHTVQVQQYACNHFTVSVLLPLQVLALALAHVLDARTLLNCSLIDLHTSQHVQHTVQQRVQQLVGACSISSRTVQSDRACLAWLCTMAGAAAVNSHAVGCALLDKVMQLPDEVRPLMKATGAYWQACNAPCITGFHHNV